MLDHLIKKFKENHAKKTFVFFQTCVDFMNCKPMESSCKWSDPFVIWQWPVI
jgi:hypothetical protein